MTNETQSIEEYMAENNIHRAHSRVGLKGWSIVGYTYEADTWCAPCMIDRGDLKDADNKHTDGGPIFASSEISDRGCAGCGEPLIDVVY